MFYILGFDVEVSSTYLMHWKSTIPLKELRALLFTYTLWMFVAMWEPGEAMVHVCFCLDKPLFYLKYVVMKQRFNRMEIRGEVGSLMCKEISQEYSSG